MPIGPTTTDANGVKHLGEDELGTGLFSDLIYIVSHSISVVLGTILANITSLLGSQTSRAADRLVPTVASTGGAVAVSAAGTITGSGAVTMIRATIPSISSYKSLQVSLKYDGATTGSHTTKVCSGAVPDATAASYTLVGTIGVAAATAAATPAATTLWSHGYVGVRKARRRRIEYWNLGDALPTTYSETGFDTDHNANPTIVQAGGEHSVSTAFDGLQWDFSGLGAISNLVIEIVGVR